MTTMPPRWADAVLRACLKPADRESISGDLLEEYRESILPARGQAAADGWYVRQVGGVLARSAGVWAALLAVAFLARTVLDWRVPLPIGPPTRQLHGWSTLAVNPVTDLHARAAFSTCLGAGLLVWTGCWASLRSRSVWAGTVLGVAATALSAVISVLGAALLLAVWHDASTMTAIADTGGLSEVFALPVLMMVPGTLLGTFGGAVGALIGRWRSA